MHKRRFVFLVYFFQQFFWNTLYECWFWCKDFPSLMNEGRFPQVGDIPFSFVFLDFISTCGKHPLRACSHDPGTAHCLGVTHWPQGQFCLGAWSNVCNCSHEFLLAPGQLREVGYPRCTSPGNWPCQGNFSPCEQNAKVPRGKSSLAHVHYCLE